MKDNGYFRIIRKDFRSNVLKIYNIDYVFPNIPYKFSVTKIINFTLRINTNIYMYIDYVMFIDYS